MKTIKQTRLSFATMNDDHRKVFISGNGKFFVSLFRTNSPIDGAGQSCPKHLESPSWNSAVTHNAGLNTGALLQINERPLFRPTRKSTKTRQGLAFLTYYLRQHSLRSKIVMHVTEKQKLVLVYRKRVLSLRN